jgi:ribonuclease HI
MRYFIGCVVDSWGCYVEPGKVESVHEWPMPKLIREIRKFLGLTGFYRPFVKRYVAMVKPLFEVTNTTASGGTRLFIWIADLEVAFEGLKHALMTAPILSQQAMEAIADIMEFVNQNEIPGDLTIHSDGQAAIARVSHTGTGPGQDRAIRIVKAVQQRKERGWRTSIEWVLGHSGISGNERADQLAGEAAAEKKTGRTSIAWLKERISQHYSMAKDTETERGKDSILPQPLRSRFWMVPQIDLLAQLLRSEPAIGYVHPT